jgi:NAD(P)-dependent dehydrogenase (short-subunit alcohol dehydrogenase family)
VIVAETVKPIKKDVEDKIKVLLYNIGSGVSRPFTDPSYQDFERSWRVRLVGIFLWANACLPSVGAGSSIGLTGATASGCGMPCTWAFASIKMATRGWTQALTRDLGPGKGIHVFHMVVV